MSMNTVLKAPAAREEEEITDLEAFHHELQSSLGLVRQMVSSWLPATGNISKFPTASSEDVASIPRGRPDRLGIGATVARPYSSTSTADTAETKKLRGMMGASEKEKRKARDATQNQAQAAKAGSDIDDDEDSRSRALSVKKPKLAAANTAKLFHEKPAAGKKMQIPSTSSASKPKVPKPPASFEVPEVQGKGLFTAPAPPRMPKIVEVEQSTDGHARAAPLAEEDEEDEEDGNASVMTESTLKSISAEAAAGKSDSKAAKRKRNKANRKRRQQLEEARQKGQAGTGTELQSGMLFGDSVVD